MPTALYVHYPFCVRKCLYCDFNSVAGASLSPEEYGSVVVAEMTERHARLGVPVAAPTLYLGGGTPSLMGPAQVSRIIDAAANLFHLAADAEVTLEANPGTLDRTSLAGYRSAGVNRLSLGVQSFDDDMLTVLGRAHSARQAVDAFAAARDAGFANIGIDLIHSLPGQTPDHWRTELARGVDLRPEHISAYGLTVEEGTPYMLLADEGRLCLPDEDDAVTMLQQTSVILRDAGYEHYEISNFALSGFRSRHNQIYWRRGNYLGFGAGAHSFVAGTRWRNVLSPREYAAAMRCGHIPEEEVTVVAADEAMAEFFFLGLRMREGVDLAGFRREFKQSVEDVYPGVLAKLVAGGLVEVDGDTVRLSDRGLLVANQVLVRFM